MENNALNKPRSKLGLWLDRQGRKQEWLIAQSGVNKQTVSLLCNDKDYIPSGKTMQKIIMALREVDPSVQASDFWYL